MCPFDLQSRKTAQETQTGAVGYAGLGTPGSGSPACAMCHIPTPSGYPHYTEKVQCNVSTSAAASLPVQELQIFRNQIKQHTPTTEKHLKVNAQIKIIKQLQSAFFSQAD